MKSLIVCLMLSVSLSFGQGTRKPDFENLQRAYKLKPTEILAQTIDAFSLPLKQVEKRNAMLTKLCQDEDFSRWASLAAVDLHSKWGHEEVILDFHESIAIWLQQVDAIALKDVNLTWATSNTKGFFGENGNNHFPDLYDSDWREAAIERDKSEKGFLEHAERKYRVAQHLAVTFLRFPSTAEEGFRLLSAAKGMELSKSEMDSAARIALTVTSDQLLKPRDRSPFFYHRVKDGGSQGGTFEQFSSARWLSARSLESPAEKVFPASWLASIRETNPDRAELLGALSGKCDAERLGQLWSDERINKENLGPVTAMLFYEIFTRSTTASGSESFFINQLQNTAPEKLTSEPDVNAPLTLLIRGALLAAAKSDETIREKLCLLVGRKLFGYDETREEPCYPTGKFSGEYLMQQSFNEWPIDDRSASLRLLATLYRLRIPVGPMFYAVNPMFYKKPPLTFVEAENVLEAAGWLKDAEDWNPPRVLTMYYGLVAEKRKGMILVEVLIDRMIVDDPDFDNSRFVTHLKERKNGRFGALLFASSLVSKNEQEALILKAFSEIKEDWPANKNSAKPPFSLILEKLSPEAAAKLPAFLRK